MVEAIGQPLRRGPRVGDTSDGEPGRTAVQRIGLYYPYIHFRDEKWMKIAALYWPRMARVVPHGFPVQGFGVVG